MFIKFITLSILFTSLSAQYSLYFNNPQENSTVTLSGDSYSMGDIGSLFIYFNIFDDLDNGHYATIIDRNWHPSNTGFSIWIEPGENLDIVKVGYRCDEGNHMYLSSEIPANDYEWHSLAFIWSNIEGKKLYIDGILVDFDENSCTILDNTGNDWNNDLSIGYAQNRDYDFSGYISSLTIFGSAISQSDIQNIISTGWPFYQESIVGYWPMNEGEGSIINDLTGNFGNGEILNPDWVMDTPLCGGLGIPEGACDCNGNLLDSCGDCGGTGEDINGNCCIYSLDDCGLCSCTEDIVIEYGPGDCIDTNWDNIPDMCSGGYNDGVENCNACLETGWDSDEFIELCGYFGACYSLINPQLDEENQANLDAYCNTLSDSNECNNHPYCFFSDIPNIYNSSIDECGECGGDNSSCSGCTDSYACNYDLYNTIDDGSCEYPEDFGWCDCYGSIVDCEGSCGGDASEGCNQQCQSSNMSLHFIDSEPYYDENYDTMVMLPSTINSITPNGTIFSFFKLDHLNSLQTIIDKGWHPEISGLSIWVEGGFVKVGYQSNGNVTYLVSDIPVSINEWNSVAFTWSEINGKKIYVNGEINHIDTNVSLIEDNGNLFSLGYAQSRDYTLNGNLSNFKLYDRTLNEQEISMLNLFAPIEPGIIIDYPLAEGTGTIIYDYSVFENHTVVNGDFEWTLDYPCNCSEFGICTDIFLEEDLIGDITQDGSINVQDVVAIVGYIIGSIEFNQTELLLADYIQDGFVNVQDVVAIVGFIIGI